jgi:hypothetical protein
MSHQPTGTQQRIPGPAPYKLWRSGRVSLADMIDGNSEPLTIGDLRAL